MSFRSNSHVYSHFVFLIHGNPISLGCTKIKEKGVALVTGNVSKKQASLEIFFACKEIAHINVPAIIID